MARSNKPTTPEEFPTQAPAPSGDYSYTVEIVMNMQRSMGALTEAVNSLKEDSKEYRADLKSLGRDLHDAKTLVRWLIGIAVGLGGIIGWAVNVYLAATHK